MGTVFQIICRGLNPIENATRVHTLNGLADVDTLTISNSVEDEVLLLDSLKLKKRLPKSISELLKRITLSWDQSPHIVKLYSLYSCTIAVLVEARRIGT
jgi:hypothetical protein